jgi:hypothetical protein
LHSLRALRHRFGVRLREHNLHLWCFATFLLLTIIRYAITQLLDGAGVAFAREHGHTCVHDDFAAKVRRERDPERARELEA